MKNVLFFMAVFFVRSLVAQQSTNVQDGFGAAGYDVVTYFSGLAEKGNAAFQAEYQGTKYLFSSEKNLMQFNQNPEEFLPEYGGYCAYAMGVNGRKVSIDPETFEIRDGKLYLFYNRNSTNTLKLWLNENPETLRQNADKNWLRLARKK